MNNTKVLSTEKITTDGGRFDRIGSDSAISEGGTMPALGDPTNYLSLALDARKAVNALRQFSKTGIKTNVLVDSLRDAVVSLNALQAGGALFSRLHAPSSYEYYEQIRTLQEVQQSMREAELVKNLNSILSGSQGEGKKLAGVAVRFFSQLENRAMQRYNQASSLPR